MKKRIISIFTIILVLAVALTVLMPSGVALATQYGSKDTSDTDTFWYFTEGNLNVAKMKESIDKWIGGADKNNPVVIGVVDTGVNYTHEVFEKTNTMFKVGGQVKGYNAFVGSGEANIPNPTEAQLSDVADQTENSHGTAVASIMAMLIYELGLQDYIKLYPIKASRDKTTAFPDKAVAKAIEHCGATQDTVGVDVVNIAICGYTASDYTKHQNLFLNASSDMVIVAASGNDNRHSSTSPAYPASLDGVLSVMGYDKNNQKTGCNYGDYDVTAPGKDIYAAKGASASYQTVDGTSMATAFVSVVSAIVTLREETAKSDVNATVIARHVITTSTKNYIQYGTYNLPKFEGYDSVNNQISNTYLDPTGLTISNNKNLADGCTIHRGQHGEITFTADFAPYGSTNPNLGDSVVWTLTEILSRPVLDEDGKETDVFEEYDGNTTEIGRGGVLDYKPEIKGKYRVTATYEKDDVKLTANFIYNLNYVSYDSVAGIVAVDYVPNPDGSTIDDGFLYAGDKVTFVLSGAEGLDPTVEIKWFVNGQFVTTGNQFNYTADKSGQFVITAQYGDYRPIENVFTLTVKSGFFKPAVWISVTAVGGAVVVGAVVLTALALKKKKAQK